MESNKCSLQKNCEEGNNHLVHTVGKKKNHEKHKNLRLGLAEETVRQKNNKEIK